MNKILVAAAVALFGFLFVWAEWLSVLGGRRTRTAIALLSVSAAYVAFKYSPHEALAIVERPAKAITDWMLAAIRRSIQSPPTTSTP